MWSAKIGPAHKKADVVFEDENKMTNAEYVGVIKEKRSEGKG